ncbi:hypothetical protein N657DRAFT_645385 [Parathielavia appendiculata]|uniref:Uncharacterized protein n=1 Tax=Parathielavia appendiculata TaxID=2587402 RepID=A0AAN6Z3D7_9PEZI|nr:hypothetical protein N657DRAFT_645385 [Parathielavia appendiculata]
MTYCTDGAAPMRALITETAAWLAWGILPGCPRPAVVQVMFNILKPLCSSAEDDIQILGMHKPQSRSRPDLGALANGKTVLWHRELFVPRLDR